ncbi:hypothetical protein [Nannocystis punicea]|uniref:Uncharacterized protein n=1 Tax=Nannocystis punicea TaxID=2995304 RepID=A0ABY7H4M4_9BACT|nr:hypothetical protein [Nannocystis poenicansa]WAS94052.1 hypothetical protein O0S08_48630 [Nannocystis poenicansa]
MDSTRISLTDFVDFVGRPSMTGKLAKVREIKHRGPYTATSDLYRPVREAIIRTHAAAGDKWEIRVHLARANAGGRFDNIADAYLGWWGQRRIEWFEPGWQIGYLQGLPISVNPELGLEIDGRPHVIKLYFKEDPLPHTLSDIAARLMARVLREQTPREAAIAVLDVRRKRLLCMNDRPDLDILLDAEVAAFTALWAQA